MRAAVAAAAGIAEVAARVPPWAWLWTGLAVAATFALAALAGWRWGACRASRERLARRADRNGRELLELADEIELYLYRQQAGGASVVVQRRWPRVCRRAALEHLECINRLMLEEAAGDRRGARPGAAPGAGAAGDRAARGCAACAAAAAASGPAVRGPVEGDPAVGDPAVNDPAVNDPAVNDPALNDPLVRDPATRAPTARGS